MTDDDTLAAAYLRRLTRATRGLPRDRRQELLDQVSEHIAAAREQGGGDGSAGLRNALERLGDPADIAAAAGGGPGTERPGWRETLAVILLLTGGVMGLAGGILGAAAGWIIGVVLLWASPRWRWPDKLLGTLVWPGGLGTVLLLSVTGTTTSGESCSGGPGQPTVCTGSASPGFPPPWLGICINVILVAAPIVVAIRLLRRARRNAPGAGDAAASPRLIGT